MAPRLIPFQGHLTRPKPGDARVYEAVRDDRYDVLFTIYTAPVGGESRVWGPERHEKLVVVNGLVNALIGSVDKGLEALKPEQLAGPLYVGITIDADGKPETPDLELVPRQVLLPAMYAHEAGNAAEARHAVAADDSRTIQGADIVKLTVPVGTVVAFAGPAERIPTGDGWLPCDGRPLRSADYSELFGLLEKMYGDGSHHPRSKDPTSKSSPVVGYDFNLPDYRGLFLRGVDGGREIDPEAGSRLTGPGGRVVGDRVGSYQDYATARPQGEGMVLTTDKTGEHNHINGNFDRLGEFTNGTTNDTNGYNGLDKASIPGKQEASLLDSKPMITTGSHFHSITGGGNKETRPRNLAVIYMIKAKSHKN